MNNRLVGATFLVAGCAIGAGMLGMPVVTGFAGFYPSLLIMTLCWGFLLFSSFLMVDVNLALEGEVNIISMAKNTLGPKGETICWIAYLFLHYALNVAFVAGGTKILSDLFPTVPVSVFPILIMLPLALIINRGIQTVDYVNRILVIGKLGIGYAILVYFIPPHVEVSLLSHVDATPMVFTLPVVLQAFGFHTLVSSLVHYLERDKVQIRWALFLGSLCALLVYGFWEFLVLGVVPLVGEVSIAKAYTAGDVSTTPLMHILKTPIISAGAVLFGLLGVGTAFLGVSLGLFDFLHDGLKIKKDRKGKCIIFILVCIPTLVFIYTSERIFLLALELAGALVAFIFGLIPILMAWHLPEHVLWSKKKGKRILLAVSLFFSAVIIIDILNKVGIFENIITKYL